MDDEFDPGCTRTLFVGNIEKTTTFSDLKEAFDRYGEIVVSLSVLQAVLLKDNIAHNIVILRKGRGQPMLFSPN